MPSHPSNLELQALSVLWHEGPSTVNVVHGALPDGRQRAYTTVLSVMQSLERKKLVKRIRSGRAHTYEPAFSQEIIVRRATDDFITNAFGGRLGEAVLATLSAGSLTPEEKTNIERELQRHKTMAAKKTVKKKSAAKPAKKRPKYQAVEITVADESSSPTVRKIAWSKSKRDKPPPPPPPAAPPPKKAKKASALAAPPEPKEFGVKSFAEIMAEKKKKQT